MVWFPRVQAVLGRAQQELEHAHQTMNDAQQTLKVARLVLELLMAFIEDLQDGFRLSASLDEGAAKQFMKLMVGQAGKIPVNVEIDATYDTFPNESCEFVGGPHDGKRYSLTEDQRKSKVIILNLKYLYAWDGYRFKYEGEVKDQQLAA